MYLNTFPSLYLINFELISNQFTKRASLEESRALKISSRIRAAAVGIQDQSLNLTMDDEERDKMRAKRREYHLILQFCKNLNFESVKQRELEKKMGGFCFGFSKKDREVLPTAKSYFDIDLKPAVQTVDEVQDSKLTWIFASTVPRFGENISSNQLAPNHYHIPPVDRRKGICLKKISGRTKKDKDFSVP